MATELKKDHSKLKQLIGASLLWGLAAVTAIHFGLKIDDSRHAKPQPIALLTGRILKSGVRKANAQGATRLSDIGRGSCVYVVLTEPSCGVGAGLARAWQRKVTDKLFDPQRVPGWYFAWVSVGDSAQMADYYPERFSFNNYFSDGIDLTRELRLSSVPDHVVLDRTGRVVLADGDGFLPDIASFQPDCTLKLDPLHRIANAK